MDTKFSKTFTTFFFPVGDEIFQIVVAWVTYLRQDRLWGNDDPLFPATAHRPRRRSPLGGQRPQARALE